MSPSNCLSSQPRVLVVSHLYPRPSDPVSGSFVADGVDELTRLGVPIDVVVPTPFAPLGRFGTHRWKTYAATPACWQVSGGNVERVRYVTVPKIRIPLADLSTLPVTLARIGRRYGSYDDRRRVVHAHTLFPDGVCAALAFSARFPLVVSIHGADVRPGKGLEWFFRRKLGRWVLRRAAAVIANSRRTQARISVYLGIAPERVTIIPPGVDCRRFGSHAPFDPAGVRKNPPEIAAIGNLIPLKGHRDLLVALASETLKTMQWNLTIVGDGPERTSLEKMAGQLGLASRITFTGRVPPRAIPSLLRRCQIFALPSRDEAWGVAWAEAQCLGIPAVGCRGQGTEEIIREGETGYLVNPGDAAQLSERLLRLISDPDLRENMGRNARNASRDLDLHQLTRKLVKVYTAAIESPFKWKEKAYA